MFHIFYLLMACITGALCHADELTLKIKKQQVETAQRQIQRSAQLFDEAPSADKRTAALAWARSAGVYVASVMDLYEEQRDELGEGVPLGQTGLQLRVAVGFLRSLELPNTARQVYFNENNSPYAQRLKQIYRFSMLTAAATVSTVLTGHWAAQDPDTLRVIIFTGVLGVSTIVPLIPLYKFLSHYLKVGPEQRQLEEELASASLDGMTSTGYPYSRPEGTTAVQALKILQTDIVEITAKSCALILKP